MNTNICQSCGNNLPLSVNFCPQCGMKVQQKPESKLTSIKYSLLFSLACFLVGIIFFASAVDEKSAAVDIGVLLFLLGWLFFLASLLRLIWRLCKKIFKIFNKTKNKSKAQLSQDMLSPPKELTLFTPERKPKQNQVAQEVISTSNQTTTTPLFTTFKKLLKTKCTAVNFFKTLREFFTLLFLVSIVITIGSFIAAFKNNEGEYFLLGIGAAVAVVVIYNSLDWFFLLEVKAIVAAATKLNKTIAPKSKTKSTNYAGKSKKAINDVIWSGKIKISFSYINAQNEYSERTINLHEIKFRGDDYLLKGYCYLRKSVRWFVSDGVVSDVTHNETAYNLYEFIQKCTDFEL